LASQWNEILGWYALMWVSVRLTPCCRFLVEDFALLADQHCVVKMVVVVVALGFFAEIGRRRKKTSKAHYGFKVCSFGQTFSPKPFDNDDSCFTTTTWKRQKWPETIKVVEIALNLGYVEILDGASGWPLPTNGTIGQRF